MFVGGVASHCAVPLREEVEEGERQRKSDRKRERDRERVTGRGTLIGTLTQAALAHPCFRVFSRQFLPT